MSTVEEIKSRLDIMEVVSPNVTLQKSGNRFKANCPFHEERTPSFIVSPQRQSWHCFGKCSTGGDIFSFVMMRDRVDFGEALRTLAHRAGVSLRPELQVTTRTASIHELGEAAAAFYQGILYSEQGESARSYLKSRGLDRETALRFRLGLSPGGTGSESLSARLMADGYSPEQIVEAGLARRGESGPVHDFFRGRLMFPIADRRGRIAGFGGRTLGEAGPKYINTAASAAFDKSRILYGLDLASEAIRAAEKAIVVEGYMDVIAAHQHGHRNVVASMGTAITDAQVSQLRHLAEVIVLAMDADSAGQEATWRRLEEALVTAAYRSSVGYGRRVGPIMSRNHIDLRIAILPEGSDPDDLMRNTPEAWEKIVADAQPGTEYLLDSIPNRFDISTGPGKSQATTWAASLVYAANPFDQHRYLEKLAQILGVTAAELRPIMRDLGRRAAAARRAERAGQSPPRVVTTTAMDAPARYPRGAIDSHMLAMLVQMPQLREVAMDSKPHFLEQSQDREIFTQCLPDATMEDLRAALDPTLHERLDELAEWELEPTLVGRSETAVRAIREMLCRVEERWLKRQQEYLPTEIGRDDSQGDIERAIVSVNARLREIHAQRG